MARTDQGGFDGGGLQGSSLLRYRVDGVLPEPGRGVEVLPAEPAMPGILGIDLPK